MHIDLLLSLALLLSLVLLLSLGLLLSHVFVEVLDDVLGSLRVADDADRMQPLGFPGEVCKVSMFFPRRDVGTEPLLVIRLCCVLNATTHPFELV